MAESHLVGCDTCAVEIMKRTCRWEFQAVRWSSRAACPDNACPDIREALSGGRGTALRRKKVQPRAPSS